MDLKLSSDFHFHSNLEDVLHYRNRHKRHQLHCRLDLTYAHHTPLKQHQPRVPHLASDSNSYSHQGSCHRFRSD